MKKEIVKKKNRELNEIVKIMPLLPQFWQPCPPAVASSKSAL